MNVNYNENSHLSGKKVREEIHVNSDRRGVGLLKVAIILSYDVIFKTAIFHENTLFTSKRPELLLLRTIIESCMATCFTRNLSMIVLIQTLVGPNS